MGNGYIVKLTKGWEEPITYVIRAPSKRLCAWSMGLELCNKDGSKGREECEHWVDWGGHVHLPKNISAIQNLRPRIRALLEEAAAIPLEVLYFKETTVL